MPSSRNPRSRKIVWLAALFLALPLLAQDMRPLSSALAKSITASGRKTVAVIDFTDLQGNVTELGRFLAEEFSIDLLADAKGFEVIDRTHLKAILQEHKLATTGLIDPQTARKLGQIAGVDTLVTGTIIPLGDSVRLTAKVLDTSTARMVGASTADIPKTRAIEELLAKGIGSSQASTLSENRTTSDARAGGGPFSVEENDLLFVLKSCRRSGRALSCVGSVTNKSDRRLSVYFGSGVQVVDDLGNQYKYEPPGNIKATLQFGRDLSEQLEPSLPVKFSMSVNDIDPAATRVNIILSYGAAVPGKEPLRVVWMGEVFPDKLTFRNVPIQQR